MVGALHLTRRRNAVLLLLLILAILLFSSWCLFGRVRTLLLCAASVLSYCVTCYLCYRPEAKEWRECLAGLYKHLFEWALNYSLSPTRPVQDRRVGLSNLAKEATSRNSIPNYKTNAELCAGGATLLDEAHPPQPHAIFEPERKSGMEGVTPMLKCHKEAQKIIQLVMNDFVCSWYSEVTNDTEFLEDVQKVLEHVALEVNVRVQQINLEDLVVGLLELILPYLEVLNKAGLRSYNGGIELFDVINEKCLKEFEASPKVAHYAMRSPAAERQHYRQAIDALLQIAFPPEYAHCDVACMFVREMLLKNMIEPLFELLSDPGFLYDAIPTILSKASPKKISRQLDDILRENEELDHMLNRGRLIVSIVGSQERNKRRFHSSSGCFGPSARFHAVASSPAMSPKRWLSDLTRPHSIASLSSRGLRRTSSGIYESGLCLSQSTTIPPSPVLRRVIEADENEATYPPLVPYQRISPTRSMKPMFTVKPGGLSLYRQHPEELGAAWGGGSSEEVEEEDFSYEHVVGGEFAVVQLAPIYIERHVRVVRESGSHIAYIFKFPKWMLVDSDLVELGVVETDTHLEGIKRFSEFCKFHDLLVTSSALSMHAKGLNLPEKHNISNFISKLPFTSCEPDATILIERKQGLEKYLQSLSSVEMILNSELFQNFLKSAVKELKESNIVNPTRSKKQHRMSFLGRAKTDYQEEELIPDKPFESVLSSYLNTRLPLPCHSFNSIHGIRKHKPLAPKNTPPKSTVGATSTGNEDSSRKMDDSLVSSLVVNLRNHSSSSLLFEHQSFPSASSLTSSFSSNFSNDPIHNLQISSDSLQLTDHYEHPSTTITDSSESPSDVQPGVEAIYDQDSSMTSLRLPDVVDSISHQYRCPMDSGNNYERGEEEEDEENRTIGGSTSTSSLTYSSIGQLERHLSSSSSPPPSPLVISCVPCMSSESSLHGQHVIFEQSVESMEVCCQPVTMSQDPTGNKKLQQQNESKGHFSMVVMAAIRSLLYRAISLTYWALSWIVFIIHRGFEPLTKKDALALIAVEQKRSPLTNVLFCLGSKASERHCPQLWACGQDTQLAFLVLAGGGVERFLWRELTTVVDEEMNWVRSLYVLRHTLWPGGILLKTSNKKSNEAELDLIRRKAADSFKKFLPNFFCHIVGAREYDQAVVHCLDCLSNPRINRHFFLRVVDLLMLKLVPEMAGAQFQKRLSQLRTLQPPQPATE